MSVAAPGARAGFIRGAKARTALMGLMGFLTLVDLFAAQALLPLLVETYHSSPAAMGAAVNASTFGMAGAGLVVALISHRLPRAQGVWIALTLLALPTTFLAFAPGLAAFTALRIVQGIFMASAFTLTMAYLAEHGTAEETASALAAYVTGAVASNLFGRLIATTTAASFGLSVSFIIFAVLNLAGAALAFSTLERAGPASTVEAAPPPPLRRLAGHFATPCLRACFGIGFCVLFAFIGAFTYVNFVLVRAPLALAPMTLGLVYFVFAPSMVTTPLAGRIASRFGPRPAFWGSLGLAGAGLPLMLAPNLATVLAGLVLLGVGTFFAQAVATGFVGRAARSDRAAASGLYLASYYLGGLAGAALLGQVFERLGWPATVAGVGIALAVAAWLASRLHPTTAGARRA
jgi:YNFM family putative membrane transporter